MADDDLVAEAIEKCVNYAWERREEGIVAFMPDVVLGPEIWRLVRQRIIFDCNASEMSEFDIGCLFAETIVNRLVERAQRLGWDVPAEAGRVASHLN